MTRDRSLAQPGILVVPNLGVANCGPHVATPCAAGSMRFAVIGGAEYMLKPWRWPIAIVVTRVHANPAGDSMFPTIDPAVLGRIGLVAIWHPARAMTRRYFITL